MSNPLKSVGKVFKKVVKTLKPLAKPLIVAAAIYFTGGALGLWGAGAAAAPAAIGAEAVGMGTGALGIGGTTTAGLGVGGAAAGGTAGGSLSAAMGGTAGLSAAAAPTAASGLTAGLTAKGATAGLSAAAPSVTGAASTVGTLKGAGKAILGFMESNPATTMIAGQAIANAFTPSAAEEQLKLEEERRQRSNVYGTSYGGGGPGINTGRLAEVTGGFVPGGQASTPIATSQGPLSQYTGAA